MTPSPRSASLMLLAAGLLGGGAVAFAQGGPPAPVAPIAPAAAAPAPGTTQTPPPALGARSLIGARCKDDIAKLCASVPPGGGRLAVCLHSHEADLSEPCKAALPPAVRGHGGAGTAPAAAAPGAPGAAAPDMHHGPMMAGKEWGPMKGMHKACAADVEKLCKDVTPGHGRIAVCLNEHANDLSPACKPVAQDIATKMAEPMQMHADCAADVQKLCADVPGGVGRVGFCLGEHSAELSAPCKKHMDEMKAHWGKHGKGGMAAKPAPGSAPPAPAAPAPAPAAK